MTTILLGGLIGGTIVFFTEWDAADHDRPSFFSDHPYTAVALVGLSVVVAVWIRGRILG